MIINKAHFDIDGDSLRLTMPIAKVDEERRIVSGFATLDNIDRQGDVLLSDASRKAFENFRGNVRLMHQPIPAGKIVSFRENSFYDKETSKTYSGIFVDAYISKGAENIWQMVLDGTLTGFSIGGRIVDFETKMDDGEDHPSVRVVKEYELMELSLVDSPANQFANILSIQKLGDEFVTSGIATEFSTENVYWCITDKIAITEKEDSALCPICKSEMHDIGWVESSDLTKNQEVGKLVDMYLTKADSISAGDFVSWGYSGGTSRGKVQRVVRSGSVNVPGSNFTINAEEGNPAVLIRVYRKGANGWERTDRVVGHKMSTLTRISSLDKIYHEEEDDEDKEMNKETLTSENTPKRQAQQGVSGKVSSGMKQKKKRVYKAGKGDVTVGDFVAYAVNKDPQPTQYAKGKVESIKTSGTVNVRGTNEKVEATSENPVVIIRVYRELSDNKYVATDRKVAKKLSSVRKLQPLDSKMQIDKVGSTERLKELVSQHNKKYGNVKSKKVTLGMLRQVYNRGIGAYRTNPGSVRPNVASAEQWALARVNGFLHAIRTGRFKRKAYDTDLLPKGHPLSTKKSVIVEETELTLEKQEGGVEVADNETSHEELDTAQAQTEASEEVEFELEETIEDVVTEALAMAKSDSVEAEVADDTSSDVFDMEKALGDVKSFVEEAITKSIEVNKESLDRFSSAVIELSKAVDEKIGQLQAKYEEVTKSLADLNNAATEIATRVESVEEETAIKKSGELESSIPEQPVVKKSLWGGRFLSSAELFN